MYPREAALIFLFSLPTMNERLLDRVRKNPQDYVLSFEVGMPPQLQILGESDPKNLKWDTAMAVLEIIRAG